MCEHDSDVAVTDLSSVEKRAVARAEPDPLRIDTLRVLAAALGERGRRLLRDALLRAPAAPGGEDGEWEQPGKTHQSDLSKKRITRRSYSSGCSARPRVWPASTRQSAPKSP